jgi:hypothetical protein
VKQANTSPMVSLRQVATPLEGMHVNGQSILFTMTGT